MASEDPHTGSPWDPGDTYDLGPMVCITHLCFVPCRACDRGPAGIWSSDPKDIEKVRRYQESE